MTMRWRTLRKRCLSLEGAEETFPFGTETSVFKVAGKIFALSRLHADPLSVSVKCEPLLAEQLRDAHLAIAAGYHLNKRHWNTIVIDGSLPDAMIADLIEDSYDLVLSKLPRARQVALGWGLVSTGKDSPVSAAEPRHATHTGVCMPHVDQSAR
jgi:predicted DNA-binding protein (MmcQ/YjbR family)